MPNKRLASIDILRALTMLLMIFVNDLWSLTNVPVWLEHAGASEDRMGFSDVIFPAFMFIIGLSIPHAIKARVKKGESQVKVLIHIASRSFALIVMGVFMVNLESMNDANMIFEKHYWQLLMFFAFVMIWNNYKNPKVFGLVPPLILKTAGWVLLIFLATTYQGAGGEWMLIHWWGIRGLLGWSYLITAILYLILGDRTVPTAVMCVLFLILNINEFLGGLNLKLIISASNYLSVLLGMLTTLIYGEFAKRENGWKTAIVWLSGIAVVLLAFGFLTRPEWGISKIRATPSWTTICGAISMISFILLLIIADVKALTNWAKPIAAGGYATLTCYLIPYLAYSLVKITGITWPAFMTTGIVGLIKSLLFGFLVILMAQWVGKLNVRLKI